LFFFSQCHDVDTFLYVPEEPFPVSPGPPTWIYPAAESSNLGILREHASVSANGSLLEYGFAKVPSIFLQGENAKNNQAADLVA